MTVKTVDISGANACKTVLKTRVGCRGVAIQNGCILISHEVNTDYFLIPGGGLEANETTEECCAREVLEETGYLVEPADHFLTINEFYEDCRYTNHYFRCTVAGKAEQRLTALEAAHGLTPEWIDLEQMLQLYAKHPDYAATDEDKADGSRTPSRQNGQNFRPSLLCRLKYVSIAEKFGCKRAKTFYFKRSSDACAMLKSSNKLGGNCNA